MTKDEHRARHVELHSRLDELLADFLRHNPHKWTSNTTLRELMEWSYQQTIDPQEEEHAERAWAGYSQAKYQPREE